MNNLFQNCEDRGEAEISDDGLYRYTLTREWADGQCVGWLCFNPSTADATEDDASIRKMVGFSKRWGYGRMVVLNLFAIRSRDPKKVGRMGLSAIGPLNDYWICEAMKECRQLVCAWGCGEHFKTDKWSDVASLDFRPNSLLPCLTSKFPEVPLMCLGRRQDNHPRHPLMLAYDTRLEPFVWRTSGNHS